MVYIYIFVSVKGFMNTEKALKNDKSICFNLPNLKKGNKNVSSTSLSCDEAI